MRITDLPELSAADLTENDVVAVDHDTGYGVETKKIAWKNLLSKIYPVGSLYMSAKPFRRHVGADQRPLHFGRWRYLRGGEYGRRGRTRIDC